MEDPRTRAALDSLADLFLTGTAPTSGAPRANASTGDGGAALDGPRPIRLAPKLRGTPSAVRAALEGGRAVADVAAATATITAKGGLEMPPARRAGTPSPPAPAAPAARQ